ncbi:hypothetical protein NHQ30_001025 [Ciborinia camelliae]|nr:hypothetical protein NHQ30_001025 [Ciborinia camelliae]
MLGKNASSNLSLIAGTKYVYAGHHLIYILSTHPATLPTFLKMEITFAILYILSITLPKLTMLSLFLRIFVVKWQRRASHLITAIILATALANIIANVAQCVPLQYLWDKHVEGKRTCLDQNAYWRWASLPNVGTDVLMLGLPIPAIWATQMGWRDKAGVGVTFLAGSLGLITSILRFAAFWHIRPAEDVTWTAIELCAYSIVEGGVYLMASCLPAYRALYLTMTRPRPWTSTSTITSSDTRLAGGNSGVLVVRGQELEDGLGHGYLEREMGGREGLRGPVPLSLSLPVSSPASLSAKGKGREKPKPTPRIHNHIQTPNPMHTIFPLPHPHPLPHPEHARIQAHGDPRIGQLFRSPWPTTRRYSSLGHTHGQSHTRTHTRTHSHTHTQTQTQEQEQEQKGITIQQDFSIEYEDAYVHEHEHAGMKKKGEDDYDDDFDYGVRVRGGA